MALGLPVVSTNVGGLRYLINNNVNGILVEKDNSTQMANAIFELLENYNVDMTLNARKTAESFSWDIIKHKWFNILK